MRFWRIGLLCCILAFSGMAAGCEDADMKAAVSKLARAVSGTLISDLEDARIAMKEGEWDRAERSLERFLRTATDPEERWEAWNSLIDATEKAGQDQRWVNDYLEAMLVEFENDPARMRRILYRMGELQETSRQYERAVLIWQQLASQPGLTDEERLNVYKRLAFLQMRLNRLQGAEDTLHECLSLTIPETMKADCLYSLADISVLRDDLADGANIAGQIMDTQGISPQLYGKAAFLLADVYEQQQKYKEALSLYQSIRDSYPNPQAVDARIDYLKKKIKK